MSNRNYGSCLAHGFYLQCQVGAGATVNKCSYLRGPAPAPGTHTGSSLTGPSLAVRPRPGSASLPKARGEAREAAQGEQELLRMAVGTSVTAPRHTHRAEKNSVCSPCCHDTAKFKVVCQGPQVRVRHHIGLGCPLGVHQKNKQKSGLSPSKRRHNW